MGVLGSTPNIKVLTLCGGVPYKPQVVSLSHEAHIIVGTAGRVLKHINEGNLKLENINTFVLDEADKMLDMGRMPEEGILLGKASQKRAL